LATNRHAPAVKRDSAKTQEYGEHFHQSVEALTC